MKAAYLVVSLLAFASVHVLASDPSPLQDFCVALNESATRGVFVNGKFCKDPMTVTSEDFFFPGFDKPGDTSESPGFFEKSADVNNFPGLNTLGVSLVRYDYAPKSLNPLHTHPRASEVILVVEGTLLVGFVASDQNGNKFFPHVLNKGDLFIFPMGLIHFQLNIGDGNALAFSSFSSQNPGENLIAHAVFGSNPPISPEVLAKTFQVDQKIIDLLEKQFQH
ncbi:hypothetical protein QN277_009490 [Acacia crassicarpa]|uniref:Germin-like protein n=1 Tax=Acacia crassicarpa TaxID=499986 RepID=A0AAE1IP65_9FABA|nr:hypothetical protein QN277_009490 [Acacia crassicarpa]